MMKRPSILGLVAGALLATGAMVDAGQEPALESTLARRAAVLVARANLSGTAAPVFSTPGVRVIGFAWNGDDTPVEHPVLRIRDLQNGQVAGHTTGTALGRFSFDSLTGGAYLIELLDIESRILAVGQPLVVLPGETVATFIRLSDAATIDNRQLFGGSAPELVSTATDAGVRPIGGGYAASNEF